MKGLLVFIEHAIWANTFRENTHESVWTHWQHSLALILRGIAQIKHKDWRKNLVWTCWIWQSSCIQRMKQNAIKPNTRTWIYNCTNYALVVTHASLSKLYNDCQSELFRIIRLFISDVILIHIYVIIMLNCVNTVEVWQIIDYTLYECEKLKLSDCLTLWELVWEWSAKISWGSVEWKLDKFVRLDILINGW